MRRALRYNGLITATIDSKGVVHNATPDEVRQIKKFVESNRSGKGSFDIVVEGRTLPDDATKATELARPWAEAGATWFMATSWGAMDKPELMKSFEREFASDRHPEP